MDTNKRDVFAHACLPTLRASSHASGMAQQSIWEAHKPMFFQLYLNENKSLPQVKDIAEKNYGFPQTPLSTYESKFRDELCLKKNLKSFEWIAISDHISRLGNPKVEVLLCGKLIPEKNLRKAINRYSKKRDGRNTTTGTSNLPEGVKIRPVSQGIVTYDRQIVAISPAVPQPSMIDASLTMQPFLTDIQPPSSFRKIVSNQPGICSAMDPPLVDNCFGSSEMSMEMAESLFFSTAKEVPHITSRLPGIFQMTYDFLSSRLTRNRAVTGILVLNPEFQKFCLSTLDHLPIMRALIDTAAPDPHFQGGDHYWSFDGDLFADIESAPPLHYLSSAEHRHQRSTWSDHEIDQVTAPPIDAPLSTTRDVFNVINGVLYLFSNNPNKNEALEYVRRLVAQNMSWSSVETILKIPSLTIQSTWVLLADCAFELYVRRLFEAVVSPASDHPDLLAQYGHKWLAQAAVLESTLLVRKLIKFGISPDIEVGRHPAIFDKRDPWEHRRDIRPWTTTGLQTEPSWYRQYHSHHKSYPLYQSDYMRNIELHTSPLVEAAVRGHVETVDMLVEGGANFEKRINGCTTVGHLLHSLFHNNVNLEARLQTLRRLLELGAKTDVPFYDASRSSYFLDVSHDTIADMVWQTNCQEAIHLVQNYTKAGPARLAVHGILRTAGNSAEELGDLLQSIQAPTSAERLSVETAALMKAIDKPEVLLNMIKAGFDLHEPRELVYINFDEGGLEYAHIVSFVPRNIILEKYLALIVEQPFHPFARQILQSVPHKAWPMTPSTSVILGVCRTSDSWSLFLRTGVQLQKPFLFSAFAQAARENDDNYMALLLVQLGDINYSLRTGPIRWNILILAAMAEPFADRSSGLDLGEGPASIETLDWLIAHGADIPSCVKTLNSVQDLGRSIAFDTQRLEWLLAHNIRPHGKSLCGIFMDYVSLDCESVHPSEITTTLFEPLTIADLPLFEPCSAMINQSGQSVIKDFALVYFIKVGAPLKFLQHLCDSGIDYNTSAKFCDSKKEPLSWHLFGCKHKSADCACLTPLQAAVLANRIDVVRYFLEKGANTDSGARYNALQSACMSDVYSHDGDFGSALSTKIEIVKCLLRNGADPGRTKAGSLAALRLTIATLWRTDHMYPDDLWLFVEQHLRLLEVLLDASVGTAGFDTILEDALSDVSHVVKDAEAHKAVTKLLLRYQAEIDKQALPHAPYGDSLMEACYKSDVDRIKTLLDHGVNPNLFESSVIVDSSPSTPSAVLAAQGNIPLLLLLRAAGAELVGHDNSLECAASAGRLDTVAWLLKFEKREKSFARALAHAQTLDRATIRVLIEEHLCSIGSDLLEDSNWEHPLYHSAASCYAGKITQRDL